jgi:CheY-like chemotaxis protein
MVALGHPARDRRLVLIVDDNKEVLGYLADLTSSWGYTPLPSTCREEAFAALASLPPGDSPDLAIVDVVLGGESGLTLAAELQTRLFSVQVLLISGYTDNIVELGLPDSKRTFFLAKTFSSAQLKDILSEMSANAVR